MKLHFISLFMCVAIAAKVEAFVESDCTEDSTWVDGFVKFECFEISEDVRGYEPTACVPSDEEGGKEYAVHSIFDDGDFRYKCVRIDDDNIRLEKLGCLVPGSSIDLVQIGHKVDTANGHYECKQIDDDKVELIFEAKQENEEGTAAPEQATTQNIVEPEPQTCIDHSGQSHEVDSVWDVDNIQLICVKHGRRGHSIKPNACITSDKQYVHLHTATKIDEHTYACVRDSEVGAHLTKLEVPECFDHAGNPRQVGDYWEDHQFSYRCLVHNNEAMTKIEGVILNRNKRDIAKPKPKPISISD